MCFHITTARTGALLVPAAEVTCAVTDTIETIVQFPGMHQAVSRLPEAVQTVARGSVPLPGETTPAAAVASTTTTTPNGPEELPHHVVQLAPRNLLLVRLGIVGKGVFTAEFQDNPAGCDLIAKVWAMAAGQSALPGRASIQMTPCQPPNKVAHREMLFFAKPEADDVPHSDDTATVWIDFRPQDVLSFVRLPAFLEPSDFLAKFRGAKGVYVNGRRLDKGARIHDGDLIMVSVVPQAPDIRPNDFFVQRIAGLGALLTPLKAPPDAYFETTTDLDIDTQIAATAWQEAFRVRLTRLGFGSVGTSFPFVVVGPNLHAVGSLISETWDLEAAGQWAAQWVVPTFGQASLFDTEGTVAGRRLLVVVPHDMNPIEEYTRIHVTGNAVVAFRLPHAVLPSTIACLAPIDDAEARPVPGRAWYGPIFPSTEMHRHVQIGHSQARWRRWGARGPGLDQPIAHRRLERLSQVSESTASVTLTPGTTFYVEGDRPFPAFTDEGATSSTATTTAAQTTVTTTAMLVPGRPIMFLVAGDAIAGQQISNLDAQEATQVLAELMLAHVERQRAPHPGQLRLAQAHPGRSHDFREIYFIWFPLDLHLHVLVDARPVGGGVRHVSVDADVDVLSLLPEGLQRTDIIAYINGIPAQLFGDSLQDGDLVSFEVDSPTLPALPRAALFRRWPCLSPFALDFATQDLFPVPADADLALEHAFNFVEHACEIRRTQLGHFLPVSQPALVISRVRGELLVHIHCRIPATTAQVSEALQRLPEWVDVHDLHDTGMLSGDAPIFLARDAHEARHHWHIVPVPYMLRLFLLWPVNEEVVSQTHRLTAPPHLTVSRSQRPQHGTVHNFLHRQTPEGVSLLQTQWELGKSSSVQDLAQPLQHNSAAETSDVLQCAAAGRAYVGCRADHLLVQSQVPPIFYPEELSVAIDRPLFAAARNVQTPLAGPDDMRYTVFDTVNQIRIRTYRPGLRVEWLIADLLRATPRAVRAVQQLSVPVYGFPEPQFVLTSLMPPLTAWLSLSTAVVCNLECVQ